MNNKRNSKAKATLLTTLLLIIALFLNEQPSQAQCHIDDWTALKALYESTDGDNWVNNEGWEQVTVETPLSNCNLQELHGIVLNEQGRVDYLNLFSNQLNGSIPPELVSLTDLTDLNLSNNMLSGSITPELGNLTNLIHLRVNNNELSGSIPPEFGNLTNLTSLKLKDNKLSGIISPELNNLTTLSLENNYYSCQDFRNVYNLNDEIQNFTYSPQFYTPTNYNNIISNTFNSIAFNQQLFVDFPFDTTGATYQWFHNGTAIPSANEAILNLDTIQSGTAGKYTLEVSHDFCLPNGSIFTTISEPIYVIIIGYDLLGQPIEYTQVMVKYENKVAKERHEKEIFFDNGAICVDKCNCNRELYLYDFPDESESIEEAYIKLNNIKSVHRPIGGFNYKLETKSIGFLNSFEQIKNTDTINCEIAYKVNYSYPIDTYNDSVMVFLLDSGLDETNLGIATNLLMQQAPADICFSYMAASGYNYTSVVNSWQSEFMPIDTNYEDRIGHGTFGFRSIAEGLQETPNTKLIPIKVIDSYSNGTLFDLICGLYHAIDHNASVISLSASYRGESSGILANAIYEAREKGIFIVTSAGNNGIDMDNGHVPEYPAYFVNQYHFFYKESDSGEAILDSVPYDNVISVAAVNIEDSLYKYSNFGKESVTLAAPGENIFGYGMKGQNVVASGTSMATFLTTQVLTREIARDRNRSHQQIWADFESKYLVSNPKIEDKTITGKQIDFNWEIAEIFGCTDCTACNYFPTATVDDGSCYYCSDGIEEVNEFCPPCAPELGCTDPTACNYLPQAIFEDNTCIYNNCEKIKCHLDDWKTLKTLYNSTNGNLWKDNTNWEMISDNVPPTDCDLGILKGVKLNESGRVSSLTLSENRLSGNIPAELGYLNNLTYLNLSENELIGNIPSELGNLSNLTKLWLKNNQLCGIIPPEISNLSKLEKLNLSRNQITKQIPPEIGLLTNLTELLLNNNQLCGGGIPAEIGNLSELSILDLRANQLIENIPAELGNLVNLIYLDLSENELKGDIPTELGNLSKLANLYLSNNQLSGSLPSEIGDLNNLEALDLNENQLTGKLPSKLGNLVNLHSLFLWGNEFNDSIPSELGTLSNLSTLELGSNNFSGSIPADLGNLTNLIWFNLSFNNLTENIPSELGNLGSVSFFGLENNRLNGKIPSELANVGENTFLSNFSLSSNRLSGSIPPELGNLNALNLSNNQLSGVVPQLGLNSPFGDSKVNISNNFFGCSELSTNLEHNQLIDEFTYLPQYFTPLKYNEIKNNIFDTLSVNRNLNMEITFQFDTTGFTYQWYRNGDLVPGETDATLNFDIVQPNNVGKYTLHIKSENCLPDGSTFESTSDPMHVILEGYDYNGQPVEYDQVMVRFDDEDTKRHYEDSILYKYAGWRVDKCDCNRELHLWQFPDTEAATEALIDLDQKVRTINQTNDVDGGFNNILNMNPVSGNGTAYHINIANQNADANDPVTIYILDSGLDKRNYDTSSYLLDTAPIDSCYDFSASGYGYVNDFLEVDDETITVSTDYIDTLGHGTFGFRSIADQLPQNSNIKIVPLQITKSFNKGTLFDLLCALYHAIDHNADIVNVSAGFKGTPNPIFEKAINEAREKGIFVVASAGNKGLNIDQTPQYPAYYASQYHYFETTGAPGETPKLDSVKYDNVISVAAVNTNSELYSSSNFGKESVVLSAPGENIASYSLGGELDVLSGTSMATFFTSLGLAYEYSVDNQRSYKTLWQDFEQNYLEENIVTDSLTQTGKQLIFSSTEAQIEGCTDCEACNYNPFANIVNNDLCKYCNDDRTKDIKLACSEDTSCPPCNDKYGCIDPAACNYNPAATINNGTCDYDCGSASDLVICPDQKSINIAAPVTVPPALTLADFTSSGNVVLSSELIFEVEEQTAIHPPYNSVIYTYSFVSASGAQQICVQSYHIANQFLQAPKVIDLPIVCQDDLWSYVKLGSDAYKIYADNNGTKGAELTTCNTPGLHCSTAGLEVNTATPGSHQFWVSQFFTFPDGEISESATTPFTMEVYPKPVANLSSASITIGVGEGIALMDVVANNTSGYWTGENILHLITAEGESIPYFSANASGLYKLYYTVKNDRCQNSYLLIVEVNKENFNNKPIEQIQDAYRLKDKQSFEIYPNPASDQVYIEFGDWNGQHNVQLLDLTGKVLFENIIESKRFSFYIGNLAKGIYLIEIKNQKEKSIQKLLVE